MRRKLYDISAELDKARDEAYRVAAENDGEVPDFITTLLDSLEGEKAKKVEAVACAYKDLLAFSDQISVEQKRLKKLKARNERELESIKWYLANYVEEGNKYESVKAKVSWRKGTSVVVNEDIDLSKVPDKYIKTEPQLNKPVLVADIKAGDGVALKFGEVVVSNNIQIK